jgi:hypothetical protein
MYKGELVFEFEGVTKDMFRFQEKAPWNPAIGTLYVQKSVFGDKEPRKVKDTVEWDRRKIGRFLKIFRGF